MLLTVSAGLHASRVGAFRAKPKTMTALCIPKQSSVGVRMTPVLLTVSVGAAGLRTSRVAAFLQPASDPSWAKPTTMTRAMYAEAIERRRA